MAGAPPRIVGSPTPLAPKGPDSLSDSTIMDSRLGTSKAVGIRYSCRDVSFTKPCLKKHSSIRAHPIAWAAPPSICPSTVSGLMALPTSVACTDLHTVIIPFLVSTSTITPCAPYANVVHRVVWLRFSGSFSVIGGYQFPTCARDTWDTRALAAADLRVTLLSGSFSENISLFFMVSSWASAFNISAATSSIRFFRERQPAMIAFPWNTVALEADVGPASGPHMESDIPTFTCSMETPIAWAAIWLIAVIKPWPISFWARFTLREPSRFNSRYTWPASFGNELPVPYI